MSEHPIKEWEKTSVAAADLNSRPYGNWRWWQEYRDAYTRAAGLNVEPPVVPDAELQGYLNGLDERIRRMRLEGRE